jgi:hypothetical protein
MSQRHIDKRRLRKLQDDLTDELAKPNPDRTLVKTLRMAIALLQNILGE